MQFGNVPEMSKEYSKTLFLSQYPIRQQISLPPEAKHVPVGDKRSYADVV
jgi:hypothetical protein